MKLLQQIHLFDLRAFDWCLHRKHHQLLVAISQWVSRSADGYLYVFTALLAIYFKQWNVLQLLALAFGIERVLYFILKNSLRRNRPPQAIPGYNSIIKPSDQFSFPSGHTSAAFLIAVISYFYLSIFSLPLFVWATCVGISRTMLGVHFPTDICAGALLGTLTAILSIALIY